LLNNRIRKSIYLKHQKTSKKAKDASDNDEDDNDVEDNVNEPPAPRQPVPKPVAKRTYFDPAAYSKAYREKHPAKIKQQRADYYVKNKEKVLRAKILWLLNVAQTTKHPTKKSIEKYDLKYSAAEKKWI